MVTVSHSDEETLEKMRNCTRVGFPICLNDSLFKMFGPRGKKSLDSIVMNETFENNAVTSPNEIWKLYEKYIERAANILGDDVAKVIEYEALNEMESMLCKKCPLYERELAKQNDTDRR